MRRLWIVLGVVALAAAGSAFGSGAGAGTFYGDDGLLFAESDDDIVAFAADGSGLHTVVEDATEPSVQLEYDAGYIAFTRGGDIWIANRDGAEQQQVTSGDADDHGPSWHASGRSIVFTRTEGGVDSLAIHYFDSNATFVLNEGSEPAYNGRVVYRSESLCPTACLAMMTPGMEPPFVFVDDPAFPDPRQPRWDPTLARVVFVYDDDPDPGHYGPALAAAASGFDAPPPVALTHYDGTEPSFPVFSPLGSRLAHLVDGEVHISDANGVEVVVPGVSVDGDGGLDWQANAFSYEQPPAPPLPPTAPTAIPSPARFTG
jgi:hypothetical protein